MLCNLRPCHFFPTFQFDILKSLYINIGLPVTVASIAIEFCPFTVALAVECHSSFDTDARTQWSPVTLSLESLACPWGDDVNFIVLPEALH